MKHSKLVIYGNGDWATLMARYFQADSEYDVVAFCADERHLKDATLSGLPVVPFPSVDGRYPPDTHDMFVAAGYTRTRARKTMFDAAKARGYRLANYVSPHAVLDDTNRMGANNVLLRGAVLEPFATMGENNVLGTNAVLCHHSSLGDHNFLAAQALVGGFTAVRDLCFFGFKATAAHKLTVGTETVLGAHSLLLTDALPHRTYVGSPATPIGDHAKDGRVID